jgi:hypothetical protein
MLYSVIAILAVFLMATLFGFTWRPYPHSVGLAVRITNPPTLVPEIEGRIVLSIHCPNPSATSTDQPLLWLNSHSVPWSELAGILRAELSRLAHRVVYVAGEGCLSFEDVVRVIDAARGVWGGVPVVLLTPNGRSRLRTANKATQSTRVIHC